MRKLLDKIPGRIKFFILKLLYYILFFQNVIFPNSYFDKPFILVLIKLRKIEDVYKVIKNHPSDLYFSRKLETAKRIEIFGDGYKLRLDFTPYDYNTMINLNKDLLNKFPNDYFLHDRMAKHYAAGGYRSNARYHFNKSLKLQRKELLRSEKFGLLVFITMPRSGTGFVSRSLTNGLNIENLASDYPFIDSWFPDYGIFPFPDNLSTLEFSPMKNGYAGGHAAGIDANLWALDHITDKIVVNFRDPRQALISWSHYMQYLRYTGNYSAIIEYKLPDGYFNWLTEDQLNWQIDHYFVGKNIYWINSWIEAKGNPDFLCEIFFSQYELLVDEPNLYFDQILDFFSIPKNNFVYPKKPKFKPNTHMRKGSTNEWQSILSNDQVNKINKQIPIEWFKRFKWVN